MIKMMLIAGTGGFVGTCLRFLTGKWCSAFYHGSFPLGTFLVNIIGCLIIGVIFGLVEKHDLVSPTQSALFVTGFCGGFTTFSAFANEIWIIGNRGEWMMSLIYLLLSVVGGLLMVWGGRALVR